MRKKRTLLCGTILSFMLFGCDVNKQNENIITEKKTYENLSQEKEVPQKTDTSQDTKESKTKRKNQESAENPKTSEEIANQKEMENCVHAQWAEEVLTDLSDYEKERLGLEEEKPLVYFSTEETIEDFKELSLTFESIDENGNIKFLVEEVYNHGTLTPESPVLTRMEFIGTIPNNGISYVDGNGKTRYFALEMSGYDGSLLLTEFEPEK